MGFLGEGKTLIWEEAQKHADYIRHHGILQFIELFKTLKDRQNDSLKWGDEIEYMLVWLDPQNKEAKVLLKAPELLHELQQEEEHLPPGGVLPMLWRPEYGRHQVEARNPRGTLYRCRRVAFGRKKYAPSPRSLAGVTERQ